MYKVCKYLLYYSYVVLLKLPFICGYFDSGIRYGI